MDLLEVEANVPIHDANSRSDDTQNVEKLIRFAIGDHTFCVRASAVAEVVLPLTASRVPNSPEWLRGIAGCRGDLVAVLEPSGISLGCTPRMSDGNRVMIFHPIAGSIKLALPVDAVNDLFELPMSTAAGAPEHRGPVTRMILPDGEIAMLEPESLLKCISRRSM